MTESSFELASPSSLRRTAPKPLTTKTIAALKPGEVLGDGSIRPGAGRLKVRRRKTVGAAAPPEFIFMWQAAGKTRSITLGRFAQNAADGALTIDQAREAARQLQNLIKKGQDPAAQRELAREAARAEEAAALVAVKHGQEKTLQALMDAYVQSLTDRMKEGSAYDVANVFLNHCSTPFPEVVSLPASEVTAQHISLMLARLVGPSAAPKRGRTALKLRSFLNAAFKLGMNAGLDPMAPASAADFKIAVNPVTMVSPTRMAATFHRAGDRALSEQELRLYLMHVAGLPSPLTRLALQLQLASGGQRFQQLLRIESTDVQGGVLRMLDPKGRREQPRVHLLPIVDEMAEILAALKELNSTGPLFASRDSVMAAETLSIAVNEISVAMTDADPAIPYFRGGDIRRTVETLMGERLGVSKDTRAQLLSHGLSGVQATHYDMGRHLDAKRAALRAWNNFLSDVCIGGEQSTVVDFPVKVA